MLIVLAGSALLRVWEGSSSRAQQGPQTAPEVPAHGRRGRRARIRAATSTPLIRTVRTRWELSKSRRWQIQPIPDQSWTVSVAVKAAPIRQQVSQGRGPEPQERKAARPRRPGWPAMMLLAQARRKIRIAGRSRETHLPPHRCEGALETQVGCPPARRTVIVSG